jgi:hypothetical protein
MFSKLIGNSPFFTFTSTQCYDETLVLGENALMQAQMQPAAAMLQYQQASPAKKSLSLLQETLTQNDLGA